MCIRDSVRRDWEIDQPSLGENNDRRAALNAILSALQTEAGGAPNRILDGTSKVPNGALDRHRFRVGVHLSTLTRERRADEQHRKSRGNECMEQSGARHNPPRRRDTGLREHFPFGRPNSPEYTPCRVYLCKARSIGTR